jgi:hypothetical protein
VNITNFQRRRGVQMRRISNVYIPNNSNADVAIVKVDLPFKFINFIQEITLAPAGFIPPGKKLCDIFQRCKVQFKCFNLLYLLSQNDSKLREIRCLFLPLGMAILWVKHCQKLFCYSFVTLH